MSKTTKKTLALIMLLLFVAAQAAGCSWMGRTTGKAVNSIEKGADKFEKGYEEERKKD